MFLKIRVFAKEWIHIFLSNNFNVYWAAFFFLFLFFGFLDILDEIALTIWLNLLKLINKGKTCE